MQESSALRKIEDNLPVEEEKEPQFGDRSTHKHKANSTLQTPEVTKIQISAPKEEKKEEKTVVTEVTEQRTRTTDYLQRFWLYLYIQVSLNPLKSRLWFQQY
jgi:outer membrane biosynthesis protein TonB